ncbi:MAG TPA: hypothetical protein VFZ99_07510 [Terriglobales bacterium]
MRRLRNIGLLLLLMVGFAFLTRHSFPQAWSQTRATAPNGAAVLRIVSPKDGARLQQNFVAVQYVQLQPAAGSSIPTFELRLDGQDPIHTTDTTYNLTGLTTGPHDLMVQVVDANNVPVAGTQTEVRFTILPPPAQNGSSGQQPGAQTTPRQQGSLGQGTFLRGSELAMLPEARSSLPLLSVIGFGILIGGLISALRTRPAGNR